GRGTRFLPATKALPKELIPVLDRPVVQWGVEEAVAAGLRRAVLVLGPGKDGVAAHFAPDRALEDALAQAGRAELEAVVRAIAELTSVDTVVQPEPLGLGHAVRCAAELVRGEPAVAVLLPDDLYVGPRPLLAQLLDAYRDHHCPVVALRRCPPEEIGRYGAAAVEGPGPVFRVTDMVEKPARGTAPSDLALMGRYILTPAVFAALETTAPGAGGEIQLTDGLRGALAAGPVVGVEYEGDLLDVGTLEGWITTMVQLAATDPRLGPAVRAGLRAAGLVVSPA
ncbi:MAG TPA: UTP--glucose-1-phosphate uridylyltransferase, partial [Candidatus Dormibacteraeota bacterium]|nr:UTP--glucose-1-phosphate uridylyltransferase [Candidatus Dormibacteraeota bacterium]